MRDHARRARPLRPRDVRVTERFLAARPRLLRLAYSQLGDLAEAEDVVQEAWLRLERAGPETISRPRRVADDDGRAARARRPALRPRAARGVRRAVAARAGGRRRPRSGRSRDARRERQLRAADRARAAHARGAHRVRAARRLRRGRSREVAEIVGRSPDSVRQLASRARRHVVAERPRRPVSPGEHRRIVEAFARASEEGDVEQLLELLDPDVTFTADGGGARDRGAQAAARRGSGWRGPGSRSSAATRNPALSVVDVNGAAGLLIEDASGGRPCSRSRSTAGGSCGSTCFATLPSCARL